MNLKKGSILYVRMDYKIGENDMTHQDFEAHLTYVKKVAEERYCVGGGFSNIDGGMILFEAESFEEAQTVAHHDPIIQKGLYRCDVFEWQLVVLSGSIS